MVPLCELEYLDRRTGGLEKSCHRRRIRQYLDRRTGGLESRRAPHVHIRNLDRRTGGLETAQFVDDTHD